MNLFIGPVSVHSKRSTFFAKVLKEILALKMNEILYSGSLNVINHLIQNSSFRFEKKIQNSSNVIFYICLVKEKEKKNFLFQAHGLAPLSSVTQKNNKYVF